MIIGVVRVCVACPQGVWMGVLTSAGCVSRALGPVFMSAVYARRGPDATFGTTAALTFAALAALRLVYSRLRPPATASAPAPPSPPPPPAQPLLAAGDTNPQHELNTSSKYLHHC